MENAIVAGLCLSPQNTSGGGGPVIGQEEESMENKMMLRHKRHSAKYSQVPDSYIKNLAKGHNNGRWTFDEHKKFILAIMEHGNKWKEVEKLIGTRNSAQIRSHSQKFFTKLSKLGLEGKYSKIADSRYMHDLALTLEKDDLAHMIIQLTDIAYHRMESGDSFNEEVHVNSNNSRQSLGLSALGSNGSLHSLKVQIPLSIDNDDKTQCHIMHPRPVNELHKIITNTNNLEKKICNIKANYQNCPNGAAVQMSSRLGEKKSEKGESKTSISSFPNPFQSSSNLERESLQNLKKNLCDPFSSYNGIDEEILFVENEYSFDLVECEKERFKNSVLNISHICEPKDTNLFEETSINGDKLFNDVFNLEFSQTTEKKDIYYEMMKTRVSHYTKGNCELTESLHLEKNCDMEDTFKQIEDEVYMHNFNDKMDII
jgi:SHAQKYF class myb-like DNA-binding protein